ncbi:hypothetical protein H6F78_04395 [Coleofasciculus sp. FACHB-64]|uniref:hypothetical protein n=1 Tax=Cyanophyceae TaxID=3028117 RepID=UPI001688CD8B|nr:MULTISPECIES: hypothetical protein [unclassified Coleofasciculus]MBD1837237.1 hypothetical protein [Coleofasciculus sp. FACHB-501]MBD1882342.1 hypothetical protein [Coleofasciculus sp. FACHB-T130]MBD1890181.1 hypothetical protein [Coleofasciculus sp. FACHB-SPT9]MBD1898065.1 hypothetical protein [Coleofasciculus sp. FACHB-129]MBD1899090.1 hypothetical protein [Coleofasciculus sp. FACHB-125]
MDNSGVEVRLGRLESIVEQIAEAVLASADTIDRLGERVDALTIQVQQQGNLREAVIATNETINRLADRVDALTIQVQEQGHQVQQQHYQIFALSDAVQTLAETQDDSLVRLMQLTEALQRLVDAIEATEETES